MTPNTYTQNSSSFIHLVTDCPRLRTARQDIFQDNIPNGTLDWRIGKLKKCLQIHMNNCAGRHRNFKTVYFGKYDFFSIHFFYFKKEDKSLFSGLATRERSQFHGSFGHQQHYFQNQHVPADSQGSFILNIFFHFFLSITYPGATLTFGKPL